MFINRDSICSVQLITTPLTKSDDTPDYGMEKRRRPKKVGETSTLVIFTADGAQHRPDEKFFAQAYDIIFPDENGA